MRELKDRLENVIEELDNLLDDLVEDEPDDGIAEAIAMLDDAYGLLIDTAKLSIWE